MSIKPINAPLKGVDNVLQAYLTAIGSHRLLTAAEELELGRRTQAGDEAARMELVECNLRLVVTIAKKYTNTATSDTIMDLIQEGNTGLMYAATRYNPTYGTRFSTYAVWWIRHFMFRWIKANRVVRLPESVVDDILTMNRVVETLGFTGHEPSAEEVAVEMELPVERVRDLKQFSHSVISLDWAVREDEEGDDAVSFGSIFLHENPDYAAQTDKILWNDFVHESLALLDERERTVLQTRFGIGEYTPMTLQEVADILIISRERVRQLERSALDKIRDRLHKSRKVVL